MKILKLMVLCAAIAVQSCNDKVLEPEHISAPKLKSALTTNAVVLPTMVFATYNVRTDVPVDAPDHRWTDRKTMIADLIKTHKFDVFGVQEAKDNQMSDLGSLLPDFKYIGLGRDANGKGEHTAIFYNKNKFSVLSSGNFWLSETPTVPGSIGWDASYPRICTWAKIKDISSGATFFYFNTHLDLTETSKSESVNLIQTKINQIAGVNPVILSADFNFSQTTSQYNTLQSSGILSDAYTLNSYPFNPKGHTSNGWDLNKISTSRIDHIFISKHFQVDQYNIITDLNDGKLPSDHYPVRIRLNDSSMGNQPKSVSIPYGKTISIKGNNGKFVSSNNGADYMMCDRATVGSWERFEVVKAASGKVFLKSMGMFVSSEFGNKPMTCNRTSTGSWEVFDWIPNADGTFSLRASNGRYVSSGNGTSDMNALSVEVRGWEKFTYQ